MAVTQEMLMKKMKEALAQAEQHMHTEEFPVSIGKLHVLCELVLDNTNEHNHQSHRLVRSERHAVVESSQPGGHEKDDSIFDF